MATVSFCHFGLFVYFGPRRSAGRMDLHPLLLAALLLQLFRPGQCCRAPHS